MTDARGDPPSAYELPLVHLPGTRLTPDVVLHRTLNKAARIKAVVVVIQWDDDSMDADWSLMPTSALCMASMVLAEDARRAMVGEHVNA